MGVISDAAESPGDLMKRISALERKVAALSTARRSEAATIGKGGYRIKGGRILIQDPAGNTTMTLSTDGLSLEGLLAVLGEIDVSGGGSVVVRDGGGVLVDDGGDITARGGRFLAEEPDGTDVFRVGTDPAEIFLRKDLISSLVEEIVEELLTSPAGEELAAFVLANRVHSVDENGSTTISSTSFVSDPGGPVVSGVDISDAGRALVFCTSHINSGASDEESVHGGVMSFQVSGATSQGPNDFNAVSAGGGKAGGGASTDVTDTSWDRASSLTLVTGLNPGVHSFAARYRTREDNFIDTTFFNRNITVVAY